MRIHQSSDQVFRLGVACLVLCLIGGSASFVWAAPSTSHSSRVESAVAMAFEGESLGSLSRRFDGKILTWDFVESLSSAEGEEVLAWEYRANGYIFLLVGSLEAYAAYGLTDTRCGVGDPVAGCFAGYRLNAMVEGGGDVSLRVDVTDGISVNSNFRTVRYGLAGPRGLGLLPGGSGALLADSGFFCDTYKVFGHRFVKSSVEFTTWPLSSVWALPYGGWNPWWGDGTDVSSILEEAFSDRFDDLAAVGVLGGGDLGELARFSGRKLGAELKARVDDADLPGLCEDLKLEL